MVPFSTIQAQAAADKREGVQRISANLVKLAISRTDKRFLTCAVADPAHWPATGLGGTWIHGRLQISMKD